MWPYAIGVLSAIALAALVLAIVAAAKASLRRKKKHGVEMIKVSTIFRLEKRYRREYDDPYFSRQLAQAVANELFAGRPGGLLENRFARHNVRVIRNRVWDLRMDPEIMRVLSLSAHMENSLSEENGSRDAGSPTPLNRLEKLGLFDSSAEVLGAGAFERIARDFHQANAARRKLED